MELPLLESELNCKNGIGPGSSGAGAGAGAGACPDCHVALCLCQAKAAVVPDRAPMRTTRASTRRQTAAGRCTYRPDVRNKKQNSPVRRASDSEKLLARNM